MSAYKEVQTQFNTLSSLIKALQDLGYRKDEIIQAPVPLRPTLTMQAYGGRDHPQKVSVRVACKQSRGAFEDAGFYWDGKTYRALVSTHDRTQDFGAQKLNQLKQRYAVHEATRIASLNGDEVREISRQEYFERNGVYPAEGSICLEVVSTTYGGSY